MALKSVVIPVSATVIEDRAFDNCVALPSVKLPDSLVSIGNEAFCASGLRSVVIPVSVTSIGDYAFCRCSALASASIPDSVISIGVSAFGECKDLKSVAVPASVGSIGRNAFSGIPVVYYSGSAEGSPWGAEKCARR